jgi:o-succinylbenzoate synthase
MTIGRTWVTEHRGRMTRAVSTSRDSWRERWSLVLHCEDSDGLIGRGEASPLPGYSTETLDECRRALHAIALFDSPGRPLPPAAQFALDTALLDLRSQRERRPTWNLLAAKVPARLPLCNVLHARDPAALRDETLMADERGFRCFKLKIGLDSEQDLARCQALRHCAPAAEIRLDANRAFSRAEAPERLAAFRELGCSFVEEPWSDLELGEGWANLVTRCESLPLPVALDESLRHPGARETIRNAATRVRLGGLVLKPMAMGGIATVRVFADLGRDVGLPVIASHLFDGPLALAATQALALAFGSPQVAAGLAPHPGLSAWDPAELPGGYGSSLAPWDSPGVLP